MSERESPPADISIREVSHAEVESVVPLLMLAEPSRRALDWSLENLSDTVYRLDVAGVLVGAATVRWDDEPAEIVELGIAAAEQGKGLGKHFVQRMLDEGRRRHKKAMIVGTRNSSIRNLAFYQKCGFRMDHVRADYFWYYGGTEVENGIPVRDLVVFRYDFVPRADARQRPRAR
ncbi:MAG TPA: GNAT family N-acetyltransferase [Gemmatimonadaceae bacterium]|jgi:GNAT superfamily N-acetyltransferase